VISDLQGACRPSSVLLWVSFLEFLGAKNVSNNSLFAIEWIGLGNFSFFRHFLTFLAHKLVWSLKNKLFDYQKRPDILFLA
jgi:hypothetical protein